jgi:hypothetical protein
MSAETRLIEAEQKAAHAINVCAMHKIITDAGATIDGYPIDPKTARLVHGRSGEVRRFVARSTGRGKSWLNFLSKIDGTGYWVTAYKTRKLAVEGK